METQDKAPCLDGGRRKRRDLLRGKQFGVSQWQRWKRRFTFLDADLGGLERIIRGK
jgi:hypothetical protein